MTSRNTRIIVLLAVVVVVIAAPHQDNPYNILNTEYQPNIQTEDNDPFASDFFKGFDNYFNSSSVFDNKDLDNFLWSDADLNVLEDMHSIKKEKGESKARKEKRKMHKLQKEDTKPEEIVRNSENSQDKIVRSFVRQQSGNQEPSEKTPCKSNTSNLNASKSAIAGLIFLLCWRYKSRTL